MLGEPERARRTDLVHIHTCWPGDPLLANFRKMAATQAKIYAAGWGAMNDTVREERGLVQSTKL